MKWKRGKKAQQEARLAQQQQQQQQQHQSDHALSYRAPSSSAARMGPVPMVLGRPADTPAYESRVSDFQQALGAALAGCDQQMQQNGGQLMGDSSSTGSEHERDSSPDQHLEQDSNTDHTTGASSPGDACWRPAPPDSQQSGQLCADQDQPEVDKQPGAPASGAGR